MKVLAVTGYKPFELGIFKQDDKALYYIKKAIKNRLIGLLDEGLEWILISGQLGAELWAAEAAYDLQEEYPDLKVAVITPFYDQEKNWKEPNKEL
ncbi:SLOG family protein, partial [Bacillus spizizenii]|nr:SLOG family protein [Bacillus spizizenii]